MFMHSVSPIWHPYTRLSTLEEAPLPVIVRGEGVYLFDAEGRRYLDAISSWWACALGHGHPAVVEAIRRQAVELQHSILGNLSHPRAIELAEALAAWMPDPRVKIHFASDGASAVEAALKIALQYFHNTGRPQRRRILSLQDAYHGDTLGAMSAGYLEHFHAPFREVLFRAERLPVPRSAAGLPAAVARAREVFASCGGEAAALIVEPLCLGAAGMVLYPPDYLQALAGLCREHGVLLIDDEIAMGFGRTGRAFAFEHAPGVRPDIVCVGKALSAGYLPISAAIVREDIHATFADRPVDRTFQHGHTFAGNPIAAAAACAALRVYREERLIERAAGLGVRLREWLAPLAALPQVAEVRTLGLIGAVELRPDAAPPSVEPRPVRVRRALLRRGILARPLGPVVYLMPPLVIPEDTLHGLCAELGAAIREAG